MKRYCIGCKYLYYTAPVEGYEYSSWTYSRGEPAEFACRVGHWVNKLDGEFTQEKFQAAMESAQTCEDFKEREVP